MSVRDSSRHRASRRAATPLSDLTGAVTGRMAAVTGSFSTVGRGGAVVAVSTGLVATGGITATAAHAAAESSSRNAAVDAAAFVSTSSAFAAPLLGTSPNMAAGSAALTAPSTATVSFETGSFTAVPKPAAPAPAAVPAQTAPQAETTTRATTSRATTTRATTAKASRKSGSSQKAAPASSAKGSSVLSVAARYVGIMYRYGGTTPAGFDCSGYTKYVYRQLGVSLPRTAHQQLGATKRISRSQARPGDLVFMLSGGRAYHVGIYAGGNQMYDSPRSGKSIQKRKIWDSSAVFGRVTG